MDEFYNRHYITVDAAGRVLDGWSDGPHLDRDTAGAICINEKGSYQVYLTIDGKRTEENPPLHTFDGIPLYKWDGEKVVPRTEAEIAADRIPPLEIVQAGKLMELSAACNAAIVDGCDVGLSDGTTGHIALTNEDQINLTNAVMAAEAGAAQYPYHLDGQLCAMYPVADIQKMGQAATTHKLYHTTYYNHLAAWVRRCETAEAVEAITYGAALPEDLTASMAAILEAAKGGEAGV